MCILFKDRIDAGDQLAKDPRIARYANDKHVIVLGLPRGGVPIAFRIAKALNAKMEVMIVRKIGIPKYREVAMGAIASGNFKYMARGRMTNFGVTDADAKEIIAEELDELRRREQKYRRGARFPDLTNKTVILADDGIATGATLRVALMAVRSHNPSCVIVAAPVGPESTARELRKEADEVVVIRTPQAFSCVGQWYDSFPETHDEEVLKLLAQAEEAGLGRS